MNANRFESPPAPAPARTELLAPAGEKEAAFAALSNGADAIYLGTPRFSARAEAANMTLEEIGEVTCFAHSLTPRRRVYVALNTLIREDEIADVADTLSDLTDMGIDAAIIQDLGVFHVARRLFPSLRLHASTQMAVHSLAGARTLARMGFQRVTLARELTLREIRQIAAGSGLETEVFIHGALCYCYSGLCLFSSHLRGRSGNRGRCAYPCRDAFRPAQSAAGAAPSAFAALPFSMKDLALPASVEALRDAGVSSLKIEGRKKSPLYVASVTQLYRGLLDGSLNAAQRSAIEDDVRTVFSRPWTDLYIESPRRQAAVDPHWTGHRGTRVGKVETVIARRGSPPLLRFKTARAIERHDGLQVDLPTHDRPYGFPVDALRIVAGSGTREAFEAPAGATVEIELPANAPPLPAGAPVYCASSQATKRKYRFPSPKPGEFRPRNDISVEVTVEANRLKAAARCLLYDAGGAPVEAELAVDKPFEPARSEDGMREAAERTFAKTGTTSLRVTSFLWTNPHGLFVPVSTLNDLRRTLTDAVEKHLATARATRKLTIRQNMNLPRPPAAQPTAVPPPLQWSIKVDDLTRLDAFSDAQWADVGEIVLDIGAPAMAELSDRLAALQQKIGRERIRLALPLITREWEQADLAAKTAHCLRAGWRRWEASNLAAFDDLGLNSPASGTDSALDLTSDWPLFVLNPAAARQLLELQVSRFTLSPEDGLRNMSALVRQFPEAATVLAYQDTPLFISETCAFASGNEGCPGRKNCGFMQMPIDSSKGESVLILNRNCRTVVVNHEPYSLLAHLPALRAAGLRHARVDFSWRPRAPEEAASIWHDLRAGVLRRPFHAGSAMRELQ